jgi:hypothetical protein
VGELKVAEEMETEIGNKALASSLDKSKGKSSLL